LHSFHQVELLYLFNFPIQETRAVFEVLATLPKLQHLSVVFEHDDAYAENGFFAPELWRLPEVNRVQRVRSMNFVNLGSNEPGFDMFVRSIAEQGHLEHLVVGDGDIPEGIQLRNGGVPTSLVDEGDEKAYEAFLWSLITGSQGLDIPYATDYYSQ